MPKSLWDGGAYIHGAGILHFVQNDTSKNKSMIKSKSLNRRHPMPAKMTAPNIMTRGKNLRQEPFFSVTISLKSAILENSS
jgi:hypothetical protein